MQTWDCHRNSDEYYFLMLEKGKSYCRIQILSANQIENPNLN